MKKDKPQSSPKSLQWRIYQLQQSFKQACLSAGQPLSYCRLLLSSLSRNRYENQEEELRIKGYILTDEANLFKKRESFSQNMSLLLAQREQLMRKLRSELIVNRNAKQINLKSCCEKIEGIRLYSLTIIENLQNLAERLKIQNSQYATEILNKIIQGADFLKFTALRKHIQFSNHDDPLFLVPLKKFRNLELVSDYNKKPVIDLFRIGEAFVKRLVNADTFLKNTDLVNSKSMQMKSRKIGEFLTQLSMDSVQSYQQSNSDQKTQRSRETRQKFILPSVSKQINKKILTPSKYSEQSDLSGMIRRAADDINKQQILKKGANRDIYNSLNSKKRSQTQTDQYSESNVYYKFKKAGNLINHPGRKLRTVEHSDNTEENDLIRSISRFDTRKESTPIKVTSKQGTLSPYKNPFIDRSSYKSSAYLQDHSFSKQQQEQQQSSYNEQPIKISPKIKKLRRNRLIKTIENHKCRQTIYNEDHLKKQEIQRQQSSSSKWFKFYQKNSTGEFPPEVQDKIEKITKLSAIRQSAIYLANIRKIRLQTIVDDNITHNKISKGRNDDDNIKYKNPFDQLSEIRFHQKNLQSEINKQYKTNLFDERSSKLSQKNIANEQFSQIKEKQTINGNDKSVNNDQIGDKVVLPPSKQSSYISSNLVSSSNPSNQSEVKEIPVNNLSQKIPQKIKRVQIAPPAEELNFQQIAFLPMKDQKMNITFSKEQMNDFVDTSYKANYEQYPSNLPFTPNTNKQQQKTVQSKQRSSILQKCIFQSKSLQQTQLLDQLKNINKQSFKYLEPYITTNYFKNRHIILTSCIYNDQIACYCLYYPYLINHIRFIFILHLEIKEKYVSVSVSFVNTFIKYIFCNDPTNKIIFLKHKQLFSQNIASLFDSQSNYAGEIKTPIKTGLLAEKSHLFERKQLTCNKQEEFTTIFSSTFLFISSSQETLISNPKINDIFFSSTFLKKLEKALKKRQAKNFANNSQLSLYLEQQKLPEFKTCNHNNELLYISQFFEDSLINVRYFVYSKYFYFTVQPPYTYLYENEDVYYLLLCTSVEKRYFLLADKIYEETQHVNIYQNFRENVLNKKMDIFVNQKRREAIVACPLFKKQVEFNIGNDTNAIINFSLNWKEYIKGVRYFPEDKVDIEFIGPFFCSLLQLDESNTIKQIYSAYINEVDLIK